MTTKEHERICFVVMPFGKKRVRVESKGLLGRWFGGGMRTREVSVDFDAIYDRVLEPAIRVARPSNGGGALEPRRADRDFFSGDIGDAMFEYLEYSRLVLCDITGLNANVFWELGHRHRACESGTVILRQLGSAIPFDINQIKAFPYEYQPQARAEESRNLITRVLEGTLEMKRLDSPIWKSLRLRQATLECPEGAGVKGLLLEAENAIRHRDAATALARYEAALHLAPEDAPTHLKAALLHKDAGRWSDAVDHARRATEIVPAYGDAHRELGIALNKWKERPAGVADGEAALRRAIELAPSDFDAMASLGGLLRRKGDRTGAVEMYRRAAEVSNGHSYPLLNAIKLEAAQRGRLEIDGRTKGMLRRALCGRRVQADPMQPYDAPWSFFDAAEIELYLGHEDAFMKYLQEGIASCTHDWQPGTAADALSVLTSSGIALPRLDEGIALLRAAETEMREAMTAGGGA